MSFDCCEQAQMADDRRMAYLFFADVFSTEVTKEFMARMASFEATPGTKLANFVSSLAAADLDDVVQDVRSDFCALFLNMSAHPVFASESVYLSDNHIIMQEPRNQVVEVYRAYKLAVDKSSFDWPEDHISMEMLFMAHLCGQEADLWNSLSNEGDMASLNVRIELLRRAQKAFFIEHLDRWVPMFVEELSEHAGTLFYEGVAEYLEEFFAGEREFVGTMVQGLS